MNYLTELSGVKVEFKMEEDKKTRRQENKKTRRQGDETNVMISGRNVSISNVLYSCIPVFLYSKPKCLTPYLTSFYNFRNLNYLTNENFILTPKSAVVVG